MRTRNFSTLLLLLPMLVFMLAIFAASLIVQVAFAFFEQGLYIEISDWRASFWLIAVITAIWPIPLMVRSIPSLLATIDPVYADAAHVMGASPLQTFLRISLPLIRPSLITAAMLGFASTAISLVVLYLLASNQLSASPNILTNVSKVGFTPYIGVEVLLIQAVALVIAQALTLVFRRQFRGIFVWGM